MVRFRSIPQELKTLKQWVVWGRDQKKPKIPYSPITMQPAKAGDSATWGTYDQAKKRVDDGQAQGIGFEFDDNGIYGIDLDKVIVDGQLTPEATEIVFLLDSYTEISPSGMGLHILVKADGVRLEANRKEFIEVYNRGRYFTVTGNVYGGVRPIEERTEQLQTLCERYLKPRSAERLPRSVDQGREGNRENLKRGLVYDEALQALWSGNRPNKNESSDDLAIMNKLAYWCNGDPALMEAAFFESPHYEIKDADHKKKCDRKDYQGNKSER